MTLGALAVACLALALQGQHDFPSLHVVLDTAICLLALILTVLLSGVSARTREPLPLWLAISFGTMVPLGLLHVGVSLDWYGTMAWIARDAAMLRPATWPPAVHVLPVGVALAISPFAIRGPRTIAFASGVVLLSIALLLLFERIPRYSTPAWLGITRPSLIVVPLLWTGMLVLGWRRRHSDRLIKHAALLGVLLLPANVVMLYSTAPHDTTAMLAHLGYVTGFLALLLSLIHLGGDDMVARERAERALGELNRELEQRVVDRTRQLDLSRQQLESEMEDHAQAERRFRAVVEHASSGMIMVDRDGVVTLVNHEAERLFGYDRTELVGQSIELLVPSRFHQSHVHERSGYQESPVARSMGAGRELYGLRKNGEEVPIEIGLNPIETPEGRFILASVVDITKRKEAEQELLRSNQELERFAYVASHDLQEPLRMVGSYVQLLAKRYRGHLDADADEFIGFAVDGATRMQRLIEDLLAFSRVGSRGSPLVVTDLNDVLARVCHDLDIPITEAGATVSHEVLPRVMADPVQMSQLLTNLVSNAIKFRREHAPRIFVSARRTGGRWEIAVSDNGIGIETQYFERIFVLFQRLHTREEYSGTGIGLAIARKIVDRHGGRLWVESTYGEGSTFTFTLAEAASG